MHGIVIFSRHSFLLELTFLFFEKYKKTVIKIVNLIVKISQWNMKCEIDVEDLPQQNGLIKFCWVLYTLLR